MRIIVSLTTTSYRLELCRYTIDSLFRQTFKPDLICLNISKNSYLFDEGIKNCPHWLNEYQNYGLKLNWVENIGPYRKLIPILFALKDGAVIVTCDDDCIYGPTWLKDLVDGAKKFPNEIICGHARVIAQNKLGHIKSYIYWPKISIDQVGKNFIPIGFAGIVYRKHLLDLNFLQDRTFLNIAPKQDDIWFRVASKIKGCHVRIISVAGAQVYPFEKIKALSDTNLLTLKYGADNPFRAIHERLKNYVYGYFGTNLCENDVAFKNVINYVKNKKTNL